MLTSIVNGLKEDRAKFAREVEYIKETAKDDIIDNRLDIAESMYCRETVEELQEAADMVKRLDTSDDAMMESVEISRLLNADSDVTFDQMIDIK